MLEIGNLNCIHFADGWGCTPSLTCLVRGGPVLKPAGLMMGLMATSGRIYANMRRPQLLPPPPVSHPCGRPLSTRASAGDPRTFTGRSSSVSCGIKLGQSSNSLYLLFLRSTKKLFPYFFGHFLGRN